jgi:hypothetical protein
VAAVRAGGGVLLEVGDGIAEARIGLVRAGRVRGAAVAGGCGRHRGRNHDGGIIVRQRQIRHRPVHFFFDLLEQPGHGQLLLIAVRQLASRYPG